jgi:protein-S-isoprenylcysteine O-methyltransferase Ste14
MSLVPIFKIGLWNGWMFWAIQILFLVVPDFFLSEQAKKRIRKASQFPAFTRKREKIMALSTHAVIMPASIVCSVFLPLKINTVWFYAGLVILITAMVISLMTTISFVITPVDQPVTRGIYRVSRHPIYLNGIFLNLGIGLACASWIILLCAFLWFLLFHLVIPAEEELLVEQYGHVYQEYMNRTPRWIGIPRQ